MKFAGLFIGFLIGVVLRRTIETQRYLAWVHNLPEKVED